MYKAGVANHHDDPWPRLAIVTVLYRSERFARALAESVAGADYPRERLEWHLVDNSPGDGSLAAARAEVARLGERLPRVVIHEPGQNVGFAIGNNLALRAALDSGVDHCYLLNPDAALEPGALAAAVQVAESAPDVGSVQSLLVLDEEPDVVNSSGNHIHFLGFGYCGGYRRPRAEVAAEPRDIAYASGACVLLPARLLREVGLFDETLWLYHEDLDLGWRLLLSGRRNLLAPGSVCRHNYEFSRSTAKWYWMERNRAIVVFKNFRLPTVALLLPLLAIADVGLLAVATKGGWWREKLRAMAWFLRPAAWAYLARARREVARQRRVSDREILRHFTPVIDYPDFQSPLQRKVIEPAWKACFAALKALVRW
jgi:GT2 family glycosyltransferase